MTKFIVTYGMKTPTDIQYEMVNMSVTIESDTETETKQEAFNQAKKFIKAQIYIEKAINGKRST